MQYQDNQLRFVALLNRKKPLHELFNALAHTAAGLTSVIADPEHTRFLEYLDGDDGSHPAISQYPFVVLQADNSSQIAKARRLALEAGLKVNSFVATMFGASAEDQLAKTRAAHGEGIDFVVAVFFGESEKLQPITKKFSCFRGPPGEAKP